MLKFTYLINNITYMKNQSKIDLFLVKLLNKMNQLLIGQNMPINYLEYITWLHKLDTNICITNQ